MAAKKFPIDILISAVDKVTAPVRKINKEVEKSLKPFKDLNNKFRTLSQATGLTAVATRMGAVGKAGSNVARETGALAFKFAALGGAATFALGSIVHSTVELGDGIKALSDRTGIGVEALQELQYAAKRSDVDLEVFSGAILDFSKNLGMANAGTGKMYGFLKKVNPAFAKQIRGTKDATKAFDLYMEAIASVPDEGRKLALATTAFGGAGKEIVSMAANGSKGIEELRAKARSLGLIMGKDAVNDAAAFDDEIGNLSDSFGALKTVFGTALIPELRKHIVSLTTYIAENRPQIDRFAKSFASFVGDTIPKLAALAGQFLSFFAQVNPGTGELEVNLGRVKFAMIAVAAVMAGPLLGAVASLLQSMIMLGVSGIKPALMLIRLLGITSITTSGIMGGLSAAFGFATTVISTSISTIVAFAQALWATPLAPFIAGLMLVVGAGYLLVKNWDTVKTWFGSFWDWMQEKLDWFLSSVKPLAGAFGGLFGGTSSAVGAATSAGSLSLGPASGVPTKAVSAVNTNSTVRQEAAVKVQFDNLPPGARVTSKETRGMDFGLDWNLGQMAVGAN